MKKVKRKCLFTLLALPQFLLFSCSNVIEENPNGKLTPRELAEEYVRYERFWDNLFAGRELNSDDGYPNYFKNIEIVDENEQKIDFDSLSEENKKAAFDLWKETEVSTAAERLAEDENLYNILALEVSIMNETEQIAERKAISNSEADIKWLLNKYLKVRRSEYKKFEKENAKKDRSSSSGSSNGSSSSGSSGSSAGGAGMIEIPSNGKYVESSKNLLKSIYSPGRILICSDCSSSSSSGDSSGVLPLFGHAALMCENEWNPNWDSNFYAKATVFAWALEKNNIIWKGKINGAQYEPLGYWAGNYPGCAQNVKVLQMQRLQIRWNWIFFYFVMDDAPYNESQAAVSYAKHIADENITCGNHPYKIEWSIASQMTAIPTFSKWWSSTCYCSKLVWRSWVSANIMYDYLAPLDLILPMNLVLSPGVRQVAAYSNW